MQNAVVAILITVFLATLFAHTRSAPVSRWLWLLAGGCVLFGTSCAGGGKGVDARPAGSGGGSAQTTTLPAGAAGSGGTPILPGDDASASSSSTSPSVDPDAVLTISPAQATVVFTVKDGTVTGVSAQGSPGASVAFSALVGDAGAPVAAVWTLNRGELGSIDANGQFTATGAYAGTVKVTGTYGARHGTATIQVVINATNNGPLAGTDPGKDTDFGGVGGVGGVQFGTAVDGATLGRLNGSGSDASTIGFAFLYPYDKTVWPRGLLPPLLQWSTNVGASSVLIHLKETNYEFVGTYAGSNLTKQLIEAAPWKAAADANEGEILQVELKIDDGTTSYGPIREGWYISRSLLQGTVYYNSYNTQVPTYDSGTAPKGAVLAIKPGARNPGIAIASTNDACHVCHTVSADGSTIVMQGPSIRSQDPPTMDRTQVFSLTDPNQTLIKYYADGTSDQNKFDWAALYPDGSMAVANSGDGFHEWVGNSDLFKLSDGTRVPSTGFSDLVTQAAMPAFSPDGRRLAFTFMAGTGAAGVQPSGKNHVLALFDFDCGAAAGSVRCSGTSYAFSNLRLLHEDDTNYLGWSSFLPDGKTVIFQKSFPTGTVWGSACYTWYNATAKLWAVPSTSSGVPTAVPLAALNGDGYLPKMTSHPNDEQLNFEPTVNPIASGGYYWVVFTSRRAYGNVLTGDPYLTEEPNQPNLFTKKLWVAAIDIEPTPGKDPSHPAFYLPGQELRAGNMRGYWVTDPCRSDGQACDNGAQCCNGYCTAGSDGKLVCGSYANGCAAEFDRCTQSSECCDAASGIECLNGRCQVNAPDVK